MDPLVRALRTPRFNFDNSQSSPAPSPQSARATAPTSQGTPTSYQGFASPLSSWPSQSTFYNTTNVQNLHHSSFGQSHPPFPIGIYGPGHNGPYIPTYVETIEEHHSPPPAIPYPIPSSLPPPRPPITPAPATTTSPYLKEQEALKRIDPAKLFNQSSTTLSPVNVSMNTTAISIAASASPKSSSSRKPQSPRGAQVANKYQVDVQGVKGDVMRECMTASPPRNRRVEALEQRDLSQRQSPQRFPLAAATEYTTNYHSQSWCPPPKVPTFASRQTPQGYSTSTSNLPTPTYAFERDAVASPSNAYSTAFQTPATSTTSEPSPSASTRIPMPASPYSAHYSANTRNPAPLKLSSEYRDEYYEKAGPAVAQHRAASGPTPSGRTLSPSSTARSPVGTDVLYSTKTSEYRAEFANPNVYS